MSAPQQLSPPAARPSATSASDASARNGWSGTAAVWAEAEELDGMADVGKAGLGGYLLSPPLHRASLHLDAAPAVAAGQMMVMGVALASAIESLAAGVADGVYPAVLAEHLQMPVDSREADVLASAAQLGMNLLRAAEPREPV
jgi:hypothetical protein